MRAETAHALVLLGLVAGLAFSTYAWYESVNASAQGLCSINSYVSCGKIDTSGHTTTLGIQDYLWGIGGFVVMLALDIPLFMTWNRRLLELLTLVSTAGALLSVYFAYLELVVIQGLCIICLGAYFSNLFVLAFLVVLVRMGRRGRAEAAAGRSDPDAARG